MDLGIRDQLALVAAEGACYAAPLSTVSIQP